MKETFEVLILTADQRMFKGSIDGDFSLVKVGNTVYECSNQAQLESIIDRNGKSVEITAILGPEELVPSRFS